MKNKEFSLFSSYILQKFVHWYVLLNVEEYLLHSLGSFNFELLAHRQLA